LCVNTFPVPCCGSAIAWLPLALRFPVHSLFLSNCLGKKRTTSARNIVSERPAPLAEPQQFDPVPGRFVVALVLIGTNGIGWPFVSVPYRGFPRNVTAANAGAISTLDVVSQYRYAPMMSALSGTPETVIVPEAFALGRSTPATT